MCRKKYFTELRDLSGNSAFPVASWTCLNILTQGKTNFFHRPAFQIKGSVVFGFLGCMKRVPNSGLEFRESFEFSQKFFLNFGTGVLCSRLGLGNDWSFAACLIISKPITPQKVPIKISLRKNIPSRDSMRMVKALTACSEIEPCAFTSWTIFRKVFLSNQSRISAVTVILIMYVQNTIHFCAIPRWKIVSLVDEGSISYSYLSVSISFSISSTLGRLVLSSSGMARVRAYSETAKWHGTNHALWLAGRTRGARFPYNL